MRSPIRIGVEKRNASQSVNGPSQKPPNLSGLRIAPQSFLSQAGQKNNLHSTSNKMHNIYKQPLGGMKPPKSQRNGQKIQNFQSISTTDATNVLNFAMQSNYGLPVQDSQQVGHLNLKNMKIPEQQSFSDDVSPQSMRSHHDQALPQISLNYHQNNNSIQAIDVQGMEESNDHKYGKMN